MTKKQVCNELDLIAEASEKPSPEYEAWVAKRLADSFNQFKENGSQGVSIVEAKKIVQQRLNESSKNIKHQI